MRHGEYEQGEAWLSTYGMKRVVRVTEQIGQDFQDQKILILSSPVQRAVETSELSRSVLNTEEPIQTDVLKLDGANKYFWHEISRVSDEVDVILCISHQPIFDDYAGKWGQNKLDLMGCSTAMSYEFNKKWSEFSNDQAKKLQFIKKYTPNN